MYGPLVIAYLFLGGTAAGGFLATAIWSLMFAYADRNEQRRLPSSPRTRRKNSSARLRRVEAFGSLQSIMYVLCLLLIGLSVVMLLWDLGRPERALLLFVQPHATMITFGAFCLVAEIILGLLLVLKTVFHVRFIGALAQRVIEVLCCIISLATMTYTGLFLAYGSSIAFWNTWTLVALFVCSSLSNGLSLMLLVNWFIKDQTLLLSAARPLQRYHLVCLAGELIFAFLFVYMAATNPSAASSYNALISADMLPIALIGVVGFAIVVPAVMETYSLTQKDCRAIPVSDVLCLCGGFCLRYCIIICGGN